jgi:hypothetical protein
MKMAVFWVVAPCSLVIMEAARSSETLVNFYQTTQRYNPEDSHLRSRYKFNKENWRWTETDSHVVDHNKRMMDFFILSFIHDGYIEQAGFDRSEVELSCKCISVELSS